MKLIFIKFYWSCGLHAPPTIPSVVTMTFFNLLLILFQVFAQHIGVSQTIDLLPAHSLPRGTIITF